MKKKIRKTFAHHAPTPEAVEKIRKIREGFSALADLIDESAPPSRERSVAQTNLEDAGMWAVKAIVLNDPGSKVEDTPADGPGNPVTGFTGK